MSLEIDEMARHGSTGTDVLPIKIEAQPGALPLGREQLRRHPRCPTRIAAILHKGTRFQSTTIEDVSCGGVGLAGAYGVLPGDDVTIELLNGRKLQATVRWWILGRCGVAFKNQLANDDPLLSQAEARKARMQLRAVG
jgi:hypothetical protein